MKTSPLGATRIWRGPLSPSANNSILNPAGTFGTTEGGRRTIGGPWAVEGVAPGFGKSSGRISRLTPGLSARQSPKAAARFSCSDWANAGPASTPVETNAHAARPAQFRGCCIVYSATVGTRSRASSWPIISIRFTTAPSTGNDE